MAAVAAAGVFFFLKDLFDLFYQVLYSSRVWEGFSFFLIKYEAYAHLHSRGGFLNNFCLMLTGFEL